MVTARRAVPSTVENHWTPGGQFLRVPNAFIRDPSVNPAARAMILWFASQAPGRAVYITVAAEEVGISLRTARRAVQDALRTPWLSRENTGQRDHHGNNAYIYHVHTVTPRPTAAGADLTPDRVPNLPPKKTIEKTNAKDLPPTSVGEPTRTTLREAGWTPKPRHYRRMEDEHGWTPNQQHDCYLEFIAFFDCANECDGAPTSSSWDRKFFAFIDAVNADDYLDRFLDHRDTHELEYA